MAEATPLTKAVIAAVVMGAAVLATSIILNAQAKITTALARILQVVHLAPMSDLQ